MLNASEMYVAGVISIGATVDYERVQQVVATVVATDGGTPPLSATALVNLTITDVNDNAPVFTLPTFTASVREDSLQGASVVQVKSLRYLTIHYFHTFIHPSITLVPLVKHQCKYQFEKLKIKEVHSRTLRLHYYT